MESLKINDAIRSREEWMDIAGLPEKLRQNVMAADVLIVPSMLQDQPMVPGGQVLFRCLRYEG